MPTDHSSLPPKNCKGYVVRNFERWFKRQTDLGERDEHASYVYYLATLERSSIWRDYHCGSRQIHYKTVERWLREAKLIS